MREQGQQISSLLTCFECEIWRPEMRSIKKSFSCKGIMGFSEEEKKMDVKEKMSLLQKERV